MIVASMSAPHISHPTLALYLNITDLNLQTPLDLAYYGLHM